MAIDTSSQNSIRQFADDYRRHYGALDVLVDNAGALRPGREVSVDGYELTFATNVLGYHLLTRELVDALRASTSARVINVASVYASDVDLDDLQIERRPYAACVHTPSPRPAIGCSPGPSRGDSNRTR